MIICLCDIWGYITPFIQNLTNDSIKCRLSLLSILQINQINHNSSCNSVPKPIVNSSLNLNEIRQVSKREAHLLFLRSNLGVVKESSRAKDGSEEGKDPHDQHEGDSSHRHIH